MLKLNLSKRLRFWARFTLFAVTVAVGLYFVVDPATPKLYRLLVAFGLLGFLLYYFLGGGGSKDDGLKNIEDHEIEWEGNPRLRPPQFPRSPESSEPTEYED